MSKESYARGFCKVAEAHGIDPVALAKLAAGNLSTVPATNTDPSVQDIKNLARVNPDVLPGSVYDMTIKDYLHSMDEVNPHMADFWRGAYGDSKQHEEIPADMLRSLQKFIVSPEFARKYTGGGVLARNVYNTNYATITNLLNQIGRKTGRPIWDVKNAKPTPYATQPNPAIEKTPLASTISSAVEDAKRALDKVKKSQ